MAPIEPDTSNSNLLPIVIFSAYLLSAGVLTAVVINGLCRAYGSLPPSQATRFRESNRRKHVRAFIVLSVLSFCVVWYHLVSFCWLSYKTWAYQRGVDVPRYAWSQPGLELGRWLKDTSLIKDLWNVSLERSRHFWWCQQKLLIATAWSVFVGAEGRRRNIPHLWIFVLLSQMVALSFAVNLFFLAMLLRPLPLSTTHLHPVQEVSPKKRRRVSTRRSSSPRTSQMGDLHEGGSFIWRLEEKFNHYLPPKPHTWAPNPAVICLPLVISFASTFLAPFMAQTSLAHLALLVPGILVYFFILLPSVIPSTWGAIYPISRTTHSIYLPIFNTIAWASVLLHLKQSLVSLLDNKPRAPQNFYKSLLFFYSASPDDSDQFSLVTRYEMSFNRIMRSLSDHPAVGVVGWDVLFCALGIAVWAAIRGLSSNEILQAGGLWRDRGASLNSVENDEFIERKPSRAKRSSPKRLRGKYHDSPTSSSSSKKTSASRRGGKVSSTDLDYDGKQDDNSGTYTEGSELGGSGTRRGSFVEGEEEVQEDLESGVLSWCLSVVLGLGVGSAAVLGAEVINR